MNTPASSRRWRLPVLEQFRAHPTEPTAAVVDAARVGRANSGRGQCVDLALYGCMTSIHDYAVRRCELGGGIGLPFRYSDCGPSPRSPAPLPGQHNRDVAAGLGYAEVDTLVRNGVLHAEAVR